MKKVPLVMYKDGDRIVVGEAEVSLDGEQNLVVAATIHADHGHLFSPSIEDAYPTIGAKHAAMYGTPVATPQSAAAWAREIIGRNTDLGAQSSGFAFPKPGCFGDMLALRGEEAGVDDRAVYSRIVEETRETTTVRFYEQ